MHSVSPVIGQKINYTMPGLEREDIWIDQTLNPVKLLNSCGFSYSYALPFHLNHVLHLLLLEVTAPIKKACRRDACLFVRLSGVSLAQTHLQWQVILRQTPCRGSRDAESFRSTVPWSNNVKWKCRFHRMNVLNCCNKNCWSRQILYAIISRGRIPCVITAHALEYPRYALHW